MTPISEPRRRAARVAAALLLALGAATDLPAQVTETPEPFDSAGQVRSITPAVAARLQLAAPVWPVAGAFTEARLYAVSTGGFVIVVDRPGGRVDRYPLTSEQREALRTAVTSAMERVGRVVGEEGPLVISEPARGAFVRNQMILTALLYAPALAALTGDASAGTAIYLGATGASFFALTALSRQTPVTRAQNHLATDGAVRGALMANGLLFASGADEPSTEAGALTTLVGGIGGAIAGFRIGRGLTDSEANAATAGSTFLALTTIGTLGTAGLLDDDDGSAQLAVGSAVAAALAGYPLGLSYPRRARYTVTAGDVDMLGTTATLGVMSALTPFVDADVDEQVLWAAATAGFLGGVLLGDRAFVRPYDHSQAEAAQVGLGAIAGGLIGLGAAALAEVDDGRVVLGLTTVGAILGTTAAAHLVSPRRATQRRTSSGRDDGAARGARSTRLEFAPASLGLAATGAPGRHPILRVRF